MDISALLVSLISGGIGGNILGAAWKDKSLGAMGNTIAGLIGGAAGTYIAQAVGLLNSLGLGDMTVNSIMGNAGSGAVGGVILTAIAGIIKGAMKK
ncbi:hypothetical protein BN59_02886 [Legionella massiliensis]|uniref:DNA methyltransferase n=1 Tax=Legionella massiliensis TaxID=1034943 RepID=A0A078L098_9GAMM|nr:hypothetical protein [Legionella massiliensis]CDZ78576.1 hypothetical protein BN59_02886 [Legionella massiliensis]CEE14314.1 hypothetical protein BN1094_02886 [Legionella massiliensis]